MTTNAAAADVRRARKSALRPVRDAAAIAGRNLIAYRRVPQLLVFSTIQPVIFVLLFRYVFGGAVETPPGVPYVDYLMPGIFVQTTVFGAIGAAVGLAVLVLVANAGARGLGGEALRIAAVSSSGILRGHPSAHAHISRADGDEERPFRVAQLRAGRGFQLGEEPLHVRVEALGDLLPVLVVVHADGGGDGDLPGGGGGAQA